MGQTSSTTSTHDGTSHKEGADGAATALDKLRTLSKAQLKTQGESSETAPLVTFPASFLDHFTFHEVLGSGSFGSVRICTEKSSGHILAVKILNKHHLLKKKQVQHVKNEKNVLSQVQHTFILKLHCACQDDENLYFFTEFLPGGELFWHLRSVHRFSNDVTRFFAAQIVLALEHLHSKCIIYRDLKPENILIDANGYIRLADLGFARFLKPDERAYTLCGTPEYLAPELILNKGHTKAVDFWSLGVILFEMLVGRSPFRGKTTFATYENILAGQYSMPAGLHLSAVHLIRSLLVEDPVHRLGSFKNGIQDVKNHRWFHGVDWSALESRAFRSPLHIKLEGPHDVHYFSGAGHPRESPPPPTLAEKMLIEQAFADF